MRFIVFLGLMSIAFTLLAQEDYDQAERLLAEGQYSEALQRTHQLLEEKKLPENYLLRAQIHEAMGSRSNAHDDYVAAISMDKDYHEAYFKFANFLYESAEYERAIASYNILINRPTHATQGIFIKTDVHGQSGTQVTSLAQMKGELLLKRALAYQALKLYDQAAQDLKKALSIQPSVDAWVNQGLLYAELGKKDSAIYAMRQALEQNPQSSLAWYNLIVLDPSAALPDHIKDVAFGPMLSLKAVEAFESGNLEQADKLFQEALKLTPKDPLLLVNAGRLDIKNDLYALAIDKFQKALCIDPDRTEVLYLMGNGYFGLKNYEKALRFYQKYLKRDPVDARTWLNSGIVYLELQQKEDACSCFERADQLGMSQAKSYLDTHCTSK